jgi:hypothetical protein
LNHIARRRSGFAGLIDGMLDDVDHARMGASKNNHQAVGCVQYQRLVVGERVGLLGVAVFALLSLVAGALRR